MLQLANSTRILSAVTTFSGCKSDHRCLSRSEAPCQGRSGASHAIWRSDFEGDLREVVLPFLFRELHEPTSLDTSRLVLHYMPFRTTFPGGRLSDLKVAHLLFPIFVLVQRSRAAAFCLYEAGLMVYLCPRTWGWSRIYARSEIGKMCVWRHEVVWIPIHMASSVSFSFLLFSLVKETHLKRHRSEV